MKICVVQLISVSSVAMQKSYMMIILNEFIHCNFHKWTYSCMCSRACVHLIETGLCPEFILSFVSVPHRLFSLYILAEVDEFPSASLISNTMNRKSGNKYTIPLMNWSGRAWARAKVTVSTTQIIRFNGKTRANERQSHTCVCYCVRGNWHKTK